MSLRRLFSLNSCTAKRQFSSLFQINGLELRSAIERSPRIPFVDEKYSDLLDHPCSLNHIYFLARKDALNQDCLLLDSSHYSRLIVERFLQLCNREAEYVIINSDTAENNDLKQRREFVGKSVVYKNEAVVRACLNGSTLVLDGLERAEPNMLPLLNSLLEQREMNLDDGSLIVSASRFQQLLKSGNTEQQLSRNGIIRCDPKFKVIALSLPVPPNPGDETIYVCFFVDF